MSTAIRTAGFAGHPPGLALLFFTELWERFSYYGMRALLTLFMVAPVAAGGLGFDLGHASRVYGNYTMAVYLLAIPGGFLADRFLGAHRAIVAGGVIVASGHFALAFSTDSLAMFYAGLMLVAVGTGLLKPNVTTMVGRLYAPDDLRRDSGFSIFHMGINLGAWVAPLVTGFLAQSAFFKSFLAEQGFDPARSWHWGFGAAGVGMVVGLVNYLMLSTRLRDIGNKPQLPSQAIAMRIPHAVLVVLGCGLILALALLSDRPGFQWLRAVFVLVPVVAVLVLGLRGDDESRRLAAIGVFFTVSMVFWAICEQAGSTIAVFGDRLTRTEVFGWAFPSAWFQSLNAFFVVLLAPGFAWLWMRLGNRQPSTPAKFVLGLVFLALSLALMAPAATLTLAGKISPLWIVGMFFLQTLGEMCIAPIGQSVTTRLASPRMVGLVMGFWLMSLAFGNKLAGILAGVFGDMGEAGRASFFVNQALIVLACSLVLLMLLPWLKRLMAEVK